ncbi:hypothetical protein AA0474_2673 [Acetobacter lovaniensis NRIC 0474]|nr:hypothetical protein AA0474_2673 [Acetobacter lovaniensis NRIC 0474]
MGQVRAKLDAAVGQTFGQTLRIGVGDNKLHTLQVGGNHVVNRVRPPAADAYNGYPGRKIGMSLGWNG